MERRRKKNRLRARNQSVYGRFFCLFLSFVFYWPLLTRISRCSSNGGRAARTVHFHHNIRSRLSKLLLNRCDKSISFGFYYGIPRTIIESFIKVQKPSRSGDVLKEDGNDDDISVARRKYIDGYERIGRDVERWAEEMLRKEMHDDVGGTVSIDNKDGWTEVISTKSLRTNWNSSKNNIVPFARQWIKWMKDSREQYADPEDDQKHPCMKLIAFIDAPLAIVCRYLSKKDRFREYNSLLIDQEDVDILTPHSKICWSQSKKLLFIQPRDFVTYCRHRWLNDGTQLITNQACDHPLTACHITNNDTNISQVGRSNFRAFSLRGATYISRCPHFPETRTKIIMLSHCNCGRDVPEWAVRAAVGILAPIKPFEIIQRIDAGIRQAREELDRAEAESVATHTTKTTKSDPGRSSQPAGMAQMGYACFWPEGGGLVDQRS